jgi:hypothetical protein
MEDDTAARPCGSPLTEGLGAASEARQFHACKGRNCGCTDGLSHSAECLQEHDDACSGVLGRCSVPMWMGGCPAGTCERKAYGERPPSRMLRDAWTGRTYREDLRYDGYVPGLACPAHGGPEAPNVLLSERPL